MANYGIIWKVSATFSRCLSPPRYGIGIIRRPHSNGRSSRSSAESDHPSVSAASPPLLAPLQEIGIIRQPCSDGRTSPESDHPSVKATSLSLSPPARHHTGIIRRPSSVGRLSTKSDHLSVSATSPSLSPPRQQIGIIRRPYSNERPSTESDHSSVGGTSPSLTPQHHRIGIIRRPYSNERPSTESNNSSSFSASRSSSPPRHRIGIIRRPYSDGRSSTESEKTSELNADNGTGISSKTLTKNYEGGRRVAPNLVTEVISQEVNNDLSSAASEEKLLHYTEEEIDAIDDVGLPKPVSPLEIGKIMGEFHDAYHDPVCVCCVCDQFCSHVETEEFNPKHLNPIFFKPLMAPMEDCGVPPLHGDLIRQYDVSQFFDENIRPLLRDILLSPRGLVRRRQGDSCESRLIFCRDCLRALTKNRLPKFAIANGNWCGQLPEDLRELTYGTLSLLRPIQTFGRVVEFHGRGSTKYGSRLTGHMYSTKLDTPLIRNKVPLNPTDAPVRVVVLSPFSSDEFAARRAKIAITKADYVIEPEKIAGVLHFWRKVGNPHMAPIITDTETLQNLPSGEVSNDVFHIEETASVTTVEDSDVEVDKAENETGDGGSCLDKTYEETADAVLLSSTATIGSTEFTEKNPYHEVAEVLSDNPVIQVAESSKNTYIIRSSNDFAGEQDPCYLEKCYPDLLPFGRGGFGEVRKIPISKQALVRYMLNLSSRQFQHVDFVFPTYDMLTRKCMFNKAMASTKLPSRAVDCNGQTLNKGEVFGRISAIDIQKAAEFKRQCAAAAALGKRMPPLPTSVNGLAVEFFTQLKAISSPMQHSQAAAARNRLDMYAALNNLGKPDLWLTYCPKDSCCFQVSWYALGEKAEKFRNQVPPIEFRLSLIGNQPVAAALHFERVQKLFFHKVVGWDRDKKRPFRRGGIFGVPKAFCEAVEEQGRLTLHVHCLLWLAGHRNVHKQIEREYLQKNLEMVTSSHDQTSKISYAEMEYVASSDTSNEDISHRVVNNTSNGRKEANECSTIANELTNHIASFCLAELSLPDTEKSLIGQCIKSHCNGVLQLAGGDKTLEKMRKRVKIDATEVPCLSCSVCLSYFTCSEVISALLEHGYQRCYARQKLTNAEVEDLTWRGLPKKPLNGDSLQIDQWLLNLASIEAAVNIHDWRHRASCFKNGRLSCRYCIPYTSHSTTEVIPTLISSSRNSDEKDTINNVVEKLNIYLRRRAPFLFIPEFNESIMAVLNCNNCVRYVEDQKVGFYLGLYTTKHGTENEMSLAETMRSLTAHENRTRKQMEDDFAQRSLFSLGLGKLLSAARAATNGETIGGPLAAFCARGNLIFNMSHTTVPLLVDQAEASLVGDSISASINRHGAVHATINDYRFRSFQAPIEELSYWEFLASQEICERSDLRKHWKRHAPDNQHSQEYDSSTEIADSEDQPDLSSNMEMENTANATSSGASLNDKTNGQINQKGAAANHFLFSPQHPLHQTHAHRKRKLRAWPKWIGQRLPNVQQLENDSKVPPDERNEIRERYAKSVLIMFRPFRTLNDLRNINEKWWEAYLRQKDSLLENKTAIGVLENMQNFYESIIESGNNTNHLTTPNTSETNGDEEYGSEDDQIDDDNENIIDLTTHETNYHLKASKGEIEVDPFVQKMSAYSANPLQIQPKIPETQVHPKDALEALSQLKSSKTSSFNLADTGTGTTTTNDSPVYQPIPTRVDLASLILQALQVTNFESSTSNSPPKETVSQSPTENQWYPTLQQHSRNWELNRKQHAAFLLCGAAFLQHLYATNETPCARTHEGASQIDIKLRCLLQKILPNGGQLRLHLSGSGGTGKSRVLEALVEFARNWKAPESIMVTASCGSAAVLIGGTTLHSALGITPGLNPPPPTELMRACWSQVGILFIDEFSMISPSFFTLLDKRLRQLKVRPDVLFGGIHIIFCGDFFQLPPVSAPTIYTTPNESLHSDTRTALFNWNGKEMWKTCLTDVVELTENHRFQDEKWAASLERWRTNQPTADDIADVNSRFMACTSTTELPNNTIIVVPENKTREQGIRFAEQQLLSRLGDITETTSTWEKRGILLIQATVTATSKKINFNPTQEEEEKIRNFSDKRLKAVGNLYGILGNAYVVGKNESVVNGIANGTRAILQSIVLKNTARIRVINLEGNKQVHAVYAHEVDCMIFQHTRTSWAAAATFPTLPLGWFPITSITQNICCRIGSEKKQCTFRIRQFPCANGLVMTGHRVQGLTTDSIALGDISKRHQYGSTGWLYVILSRVRTLQGLTTLTRLTEDPSKFKARKYVLDEMQRLRQIEENTLHRLPT